MVGTLLALSILSPLLHPISLNLVLFSSHPIPSPLPTPLTPRCQNSQFNIRDHLELSIGSHTLTHSLTVPRPQPPALTLPFSLLPSSPPFLPSCQIYQDNIRDLLELSIGGHTPTRSGSSRMSIGGGFGSNQPSTRLVRSGSGSMMSPSTSPSKRQIIVRETGGEVTLEGVTEQVVSCKEDAMACLEHGLLFRATGGHQLNAASR